jgi:antitoxin CcdA
MRMRRAHPKTATNLSVRTDLLRAARALKLNLSAVLEQALEQAVRDGERRAWLAQNEDAIDAYNAQVEKRGVFSDDCRSGDQRGGDHQRMVGAASRAA